jgi:nickel-type superoxide dismutase maturation protease
VTVSGRNRLASMAQGVGIAGGVLAVAATAAVRPRRVVVAGRSMEPTLLAGDRLLVARFGRPRVGDVVALRDPTDARRVMVKRIAAIRRQELYVTGDNPEASIDSRVFGSVPRAALLGKVVRRYAPAARAGSVI